MPTNACDMPWLPLQTLNFIRKHPLASGHFGEALQRYVRWQIGSRIASGPIAVPFVNESRLLVRRGMTGATGNVYVGLHEFEDMAFVLHALRADDLFVDVGANVGTYSVLAAKVVGAKVVAFEPVPSTHAALMDNVRLNGIEARCTVYRAGVGRHEGTLRMTATADTTNHVLTAAEAAESAEQDSVEVPVVSLDGALNGEIPLAMKIDVEGFETEVIAGAARTLPATGLHAIVMELNTAGERYGHNDLELATRVGSLGFLPYAYEPFSRTLTTIQSASNSTANTIFIRDIEAVRKRVREAPAFHVQNRSV